MTKNNRQTVIIGWLVLLFGQSSAYANDVQVIEQVGDIVQVAIPAMAYGATFYYNDDVGRQQFYQAFGTNMATTYALKYTIDKKRPNGGKHSFPSGHTSAAFQGAAFIHKRYGIDYAIPAYLGATFVGYSRIEAKKHDIVDVLAGAGIGMVSSFYFTDRFGDNAQIMPITSPNYYGVMVNYQF